MTATTGSGFWQNFIKEARQFQRKEQHAADLQEVKIERESIMKSLIEQRGEHYSHEVRHAAQHDNNDSHVSRLHQESSRVR